MPGISKTAESVDAARCLEDSLHTYMITTVPGPCNDSEPFTPGALRGAPAY
jgi:hypothetical protein